MHDSSPLGLFWVSQNTSFSLWPLTPPAALISAMAACSAASRSGCDNVGSAMGPAPPSVMTELAPEPPGSPDPLADVAPELLLHPAAASANSAPTATAGSRRLRYIQRMRSSLHRF